MQACMTRKGGAEEESCDQPLWGNSSWEVQPDGEPGVRSPTDHIAVTYRCAKLNIFARTEHQFDQNERKLITESSIEC